MPDPAPSDSASPSPYELTPLAQLGAVTGRFVHDLANDISSAATLMTLITEPDVEGTPAKEDLEELNAALERAVTLIHHFGATVRTLRPPPTPIPYASIAPQIQAHISHYKIPLTVDPSLTDDTEILCHADWLRHILDYAARLQEGAATGVTFSLVPAKSVTPPVDYYSIDKPTHLFKASVQFPAGSPLPALEKFIDNQPLFVARELVRHMRGFLLTESNSDHAAFNIYLSTSLQ